MNASFYIKENHFGLNFEEIIMLLAKIGSMKVLAFWLVLQGVITIFNVRISNSEIILAIIALVAGGLMILERGKIPISGKIGKLLLSIWLILGGLMTIFNISFTNDGMILAILAVAAGIILFMRGE